LISALAISGIPLTSGFLSKDGILAGSLAFSSLTGHWLIPLLGFTVAMMTAFYMFRLVILTFHGETRNKEKFDHAHESPFVMVMPLVVLTLLSLFIWYTPNPLSSESGWFLSDWIKTPQTVVPEEVRFDFMKTSGEAEITDPSIVHSEEYVEAMHHAHWPAVALSLGLGGLGILFAFLLYQWKKIDPDKLAEKLKPLYNLSFNKWYLDEIYHATFVAGTIGLSKVLRWFDNKIIDGIVNGSAALTRGISKLSGWHDTFVIDGLVNFTAFLSGFLGLSFRKLQTGKVQTYLVFVVFSVLIIWWLFELL
jgi:NADH-quinone oxidoreductase subunit L